MIDSSVLTSVFSTYFAIDSIVPIPPRASIVISVNSAYLSGTWYRFFSGTVHDTISRGGRVLIPVFALGRAQELLLILGIDLLFINELQI